MTPLQVQVPFARGDAAPPPSSPATTASPQPPPSPPGVAPSPEHLAKEESPVTEPQGLQRFFPPAEGIQVPHEASLQVSTFEMLKEKGLDLHG